MTTAEQRWWLDRIAEQIGVNLELAVTWTTASSSTAAAGWARSARWARSGWRWWAR